jgi:choline kinase
MNGVRLHAKEQVAVAVLAAGLGQRLAPVSGGRPKWLLEVAGLTIADRQLEGFTRLGATLSHTIAVIGAGAEHVRAVAVNHRIHTIFNDQFDRLNNWYSALLALDQLNREDADLVVLVNADLCASPDFFEGFVRDALATDAAAMIAADFGRPLTDEAMKMSRRAGADPLLLGAIGKTGVEHPVAEYPGLVALRPARAREYAEQLRTFTADPGCHNNWYEHGIQAELRRGRPWTMIPVRAADWVEIDTPDDLAAATSLLGTVA